ncbi:MAG: tetratricopeptide repeat protein [Bacteroidetes bacterium]|nr:tetratricopeptide repeat protein [Bacteroidota bacterium]
MKKIYLLILFFIFSGNGHLIFCQGNVIDSLSHLLQKTKSDSEQVKLLNSICWQQFILEDYANAKMNGNEALKRARTLNLSKEVARSYSYLGSIASREGNYQEAIADYFSSLKIREKMNDRKGVAGIYNNMGMVYESQNNLKDALQSFRSAVSIFDSLKDKKGIGNGLLNIANIYNDQNLLDSALKLYEQALNYRTESDDARGMATCYNDIAVVYDRLDKNDKALEYYNKALQIRQEIEDDYGVATVYVNLSEFYMKLNEMNKAKIMIDDAIRVSEEIQSKDELLDCYETLYHLDSICGDFKGAYSSYKEYITYRDSLINEQNTKKIVQQQMQYGFDKKTSADSIKNSEQKKHDDLKHKQEIQQQKIYTYGGALGFALMLVVAVVSLRAFRNKQKANEIISAQKLLVEEKQKEILDSIHYAKRIQNALLPNEKYIRNSLDR